MDAAVVQQSLDSALGDSGPSGDKIQECWEMPRNPLRNFKVPAAVRQGQSKGSYKGVGPRKL